MAIHAQRIVRHLHHPQPALLIPVKRHRIEHHRLRCGEFDTETLADVDFLLGLFGREGL